VIQKPRLREKSASLGTGLDGLSKTCKIASLYAAFRRFVTAYYYTILLIEMNRDKYKSRIIAGIKLTRVGMVSGIIRILRTSLLAFFS